VIADRYALGRQLGSGGMSRVYLAHDRKLDREVAVKILSERYAADPAFVERFRREATSAAALNHPNIVSVFDRGEADGAYFIVMEYLAGPDLKREIREQGPFAPVEAIDVQLQILGALGAAHRRSVIHRDVKPQNVMFTEDGRVKVTDFGIARAGATDLTEAGLIIGTAQYLSPEQAQGREVTSASDCYAAGIVLYEMLTGRVPFDGDRPVTVALMQVNDAPVDPRTIDPTIPAQLAGVVMKSLEKHPSDRYTSAEDFTRALRIVRDELTGEGDTRILRQDTAETTVIQGTAETTVIPTRRAQPGPPPPPRRSGPPARRNAAPPPKGRGRLVAGLLGLLAVIGAVTAFWLISGGGGESTVGVPDVQALSAADAQTALEKQGFVVRIVKQPNGVVDDGSVIGTRPGAETQLANKSKVDLLISTGPVQKPVPDVRNMDATRANATLKKAGFDPIEDSPAFDDTVPKGSVISQNPEASTQAAPGAEVHIVVSKGADQVVVPDLSKLSIDTATTQLESAKLHLGKQDGRDSRAQPGTIIGQTPPRGTKVAPGTLVNVIVAREPDTITIPTGLVGQSAKAVLAKLKALNLSVTSETVDPPNGEAEGIVVGLNPIEGSKVAPDKNIVISVSSGPAPPAAPTVPSVVGQGQEAAQGTLTQQGFKVEVATEAPTNGEAAGQVLRQNPGADQAAPAGSTVTIFVSTGPPPPP
jgi:eukaryotic-like serine/threonine-protein kinase